MEPFRGDSPEVKDLTLYANGGDEKKYESIDKIFF